MTPEMHKQIEAMQRDLARAIEERNRLETALEQINAIPGTRNASAALLGLVSAQSIAREALKGVRS